MKNIKTRLLVLMLLLCSSIWAQQDAQFTQYRCNIISINPAFGVHIRQWIGLDGAPVSNNISLHIPINNSNLGYGVSFGYD